MLSPPQMVWGPRGKRLALISVVCVLGDGCCSEALCNELVSPGSSYTAELAETAADSGESGPRCDAAFGLEAGDTLRFDGVARGEVHNPGHYCSNDCYRVRSEPSLQGAHFTDADTASASALTELQSADTIASGRVELSGGCMGVYAIGLRPLPEPAPGPAESTTTALLSVRFQPSEPACTGPCGGSWLARITKHD